MLAATNGRLDSPNFFLGVEEHGEPSFDPPLVKFLPALRNWLSSFDPDRLSSQAKAHGLDSLPRLRCEHDGWTVDFTPFPKSVDLRGQPDLQSISLELGGGAKALDLVGPIRSAMARKATRDGDLDLPYAVAVNELYDYALREGDIISALFGSEQVVARRDAQGRREPVWTRAADGAWFGPGGKRCTGVSALLIAYHVQPWSAGHADV